MDNAMFSSKKKDYGTPQWLFNIINNAVGGFSIDLCANDTNSKCEKYYGGKNGDSLSQSWIGTGWLNPPYGEAEAPYSNSCKKKVCETRGFHNYERIPGCLDFLKRAWIYSRYNEMAHIVALIPAKTDTEAWQTYVPIYEPYSVSFLSGRIKFDGGEHGAAFPSAIIAYSQDIGFRKRVFDAVSRINSSEKRYGIPVGYKDWVREHKTACSFCVFGSVIDCKLAGSCSAKTNFTGFIKKAV
jgi:phage N-6-adenine-methyltransferase